MKQEKGLMVEEKEVTESGRCLKSFEDVRRGET